MFENIFPMRGSAFSAVIQVDSHTDTIHFYTKSGGQLSHDQAGCKMTAFDADFFDRFGKIIQRYKQAHPGVDLQKCVIILPDHLFLTDTVKIPVIHRRAMNQSLNLAIASVYQNMAELNIHTIGIQQNRQQATYGLVGIRQDILAKLRQACAQQNVGISAVTFAANAAVNGAFAANPKLKNGTFLLLDMHEHYARFAFVGKGTTLGYYDLPFGYDCLQEASLASEDLLFDHGPAERLVRSANELARAKPSDLPAEPGKSARNLPKFMQRPEPQSSEEYIYENFRIFMKWSLDLIRGNPDFVSPGEGITVYVNMPPKYRYLFAMANAQDNGQRVTFAPLTSDDLDMDLALCGGFHCNIYNKQNTF